MFRLVLAVLIAVSATRSTLALDEVMRDGAKKYLARYAQAQTDTPVVPGETAAPVEPSDEKAKPATVQTKKSFWTHNRSRMYMTEDGTRRRIYYEDPRAGLKESGVKQGTLLFDGVVDGTTASGTAYTFAKDCDPLSFSVKGKLTRDGKRITLAGKAPRVGTQCRIAGVSIRSLSSTWSGKRSKRAEHPVSKHEKTGGVRCQHDHRSDDQRR